MDLSDHSAESGGLNSVTIGDGAEPTVARVTSRSFLFSDFQYPFVRAGPATSRAPGARARGMARVDIGRSRESVGSPRSPSGAGEPPDGLE